MKTTMSLINLRMELLATVRQDYENRGYRLSDNMLANTLRYVYNMILPAYKQ